MAGKKVIPRELSIYINDREVVNSLGGITREVGRVNGEIKNLNKNSATYDEDLKRLKGTLSDLKDSQQGFKDELEETGEIAGKATEAIGNIVGGLLSGDLKKAQTGMLALRGSIGAATKTALAFIATPIGATIAVLAGIAFAAKEIFYFNKELEKSSKVLRGLGVDAQELSAVRDEILATAETFDKEFSEIAEKANSLSKSYGISMSEANDIIAKGLADGGAQNDEFLDSIGEYDEFFAKAGYSAQEFIDVVNQGFELGIYSDKLPDALKEADLALKEQTKSTRDALVNAFGESFSNEILDKVRTGELNTKQALDNIAAKAKETGLSQQQQAQLTADLFKGAGEDAGGALKIFEAIEQARQRELSESGKAIDELRVANEKLNKAQSDLFEIENFSGVWDSIKTFVVNSITAVLQQLQLLKFQFKLVFNVVQNVFINISNFIVGTFSGIVTRISPILKALGVDVDALQKRLDGLKSKNVVLNLKSNRVDDEKKTSEQVITVNKEEQDRLAKIKADADKKSEDARKKQADKIKADQEKAAKEEEARLLALANAKANLAKAELASFIANNASKLDSDKKLTQEMVDEEIRRLAAIHDRKDTELAEQRLRDIAKAEQEAKSAEELAVLKQTIDVEYLTQKQNLDLEFQQSTDELKKEYIAEQKQLELEQLKLDNELALEEAATKEEEDAIKRQQDYDARIKELKKFREEEKITDVEYKRFVDALNKQKAKDERLAEIQSIDDKLKDLGRLADAVTAIFGENKAAASAQALINGGLAVTEILRQESELPAVATAIFKGIQIAGVAATTSRSISQINSAKAPKRARFFYGGNTGNTPSLGYDEFGPVTGYVHSNEWVAPASMTQNPRYAATLSWLENERKSNGKRGFVEGGETTAGSLPSFVETSTQNNDALFSAINRLNANLEAGINAKVFFGYEDAEKVNNLNTERQQSSDNGRIATS